MPAHRTLHELGIYTDHSIVVPVFRDIHPIPTLRKCALPPPDEPRRPPAAFKALKTLTAKDAHAILVEYLEERPLYVLQRGMGLRLTTYYRRLGEADLGSQVLNDEFSEGLAANQVLNPYDVTAALFPLCCFASLQMQLIATLA